MINKFKTLNTTFGILFLFIPLILIIVNKEVRPSISDYAYSSHNYLFFSLISISGFLFIVNGWLDPFRRYNIILGLSLIGVALTPHKDYPIIHYLCAGSFFLGSVYVIIYFSSSNQRFYKIISSSIIVFSLICALLIKNISILVAEWIGMIPISLHYILEAQNKIN